MSEKASVHQGHRARMRERFLQTGPESFGDHEILEMLLYYVLPRQDTNEHAHCVLEEFGSLSRALEAGPEYLKNVQGIGENAALFLSLVGECARRYAAAKFESAEKTVVFDTPRKIAAFLAPRFLGLTAERAYVLLFDNAMRMIDCFHLGDGSVIGVPISTRRIAERALAKNAAAVVVAHNHPSGRAVPSGEDRHMTARLKEALQLINIPLVEHFVFAEREYAPILHHYEPEREEQYACASFLEILQKQTPRETGKEPKQ